MTDPLRKAAEGLLACVPEPIGLVGGYTNVPTRCIEALRSALQPPDAGGEETLEQRLKDAAARVAAMSLLRWHPAEVEAWLRGPVKRGGRPRG